MFRANSSNQEILSEIVEIITEQSLIIKEIKEEKKLILTFKSNYLFQENFILKKKININESLIEYLYEKIEYLLSVNEELKSKITDLTNQNKVLENEINSKKNIEEKINDLEKRINF